MLTRKKTVSGLIGLLAFSLNLASVPVGATTNPHPTSRFVVSNPELPTTALRLRQLIDASVSGPEVQRYSLKLKRGQFAAVRVGQKTGNVVATLFDPDGKIVAIVDNNGQGLGEVATLLAEKTGTYSIQIAIYEWDSPKASYSIEWTRLENGRLDPVGRADQLFRSWYAPKAPGAALIVKKSGKLLYTGAQGIENAETRRPITLNTAFDVASLSKQFTGYSIALMIDRGQIRLDDDIRTFLPELPDYGAKISVKNLLEHTSGLRDWDGLFALAGRNIEDDVTLDEIVALAQRQKGLNFQPGSKQVYSNTNYSLLAKIVERVSGMSFSAWTSQNIFQPLGLKSCSFPDPLKPALGHQIASFKAQYPVLASHSTRRMLAVGSSSLACSAYDLSKWLENYRSGQLGGDRVKEFVTVAANPPTLGSDYVFGNWFSTYSGKNFVGHLGLAAGFRAAIRRFPKEDLDIIYLTNDGNDATYERVQAIQNLFLGIAEPKVEAPVDADYVPVIPQRLEDAFMNQLVGRYRSEDLQTDYEILRQGDQIIAKQARLGILPLQLVAGDNFASKKSFLPSLTFIRDSNNVVTSFKVDSEDVSGLIFTRLP